MKKRKILAVLCLAMLLAVAQPMQALACTGVYVGSDYAASGARFAGRTEDLSNPHVKVFGVRPSEKKIVFSNPGEYDETFTHTVEGPTLRYTYCRDGAAYNDDDENGAQLHAFEEVGQNEKGVSVSATVSISFRSEVRDKTEGQTPLYRQA